MGEWEWSWCKYMMQCLNTEYAGNVNSNCIGLKNSVMWIGKILKMGKKTLNTG